ncbi:MAG TPA: glycoside hydrolase family 3 N-terminal domain-containing protein, partial [Polyangiaceae bacterium]|nr:glycoside hydrolase family 3 N-terminal domain-containing protein [Polyangiaceae bacterium]
MRSWLALLLVYWLCSPSSARAEAPATSPRVEALLSRMTLDEKLGQLTQVGGDAPVTGPHAATGTADEIRNGHIGSFLGVLGAETTRRLQRIAVEETRLHIPLLFGSDVIHGFRTIFPVPLGEAASWDVALAERCARVAALEATAHGIDWDYAPMVDIARDPRWGRVVEGAGEDPFLGSAFAVARVRGLSGGTGAVGTSMIATAKHFVAYGAAEGGRDYNTADISERTLREIYLPPFRAAVEAGAGSVMAAFNELAGVPMHANRRLLRNVLRDEWGFRGMVVSDWAGIAQLVTQGVAATPADAARLSLSAGVDVDMVSRSYLHELPALVRREPRLSRAIDDAVRRVLQAKLSLGLFDDPYRYSDVAREASRTSTPEARALSRRAARESLVLLENRGSILPLSKGLTTLAVVGALAEDTRSVLGSWAASGRPEEAVSLLAGIRAAVSPKTRVLYARGASPTSNDSSGFAEAERVAQSADAVIAVVGETEDMSGEARSRAQLELPGAQQALVERLAATGKRLVVILMNGRPLVLSRLVAQAPAVLEAWYPGTEAGHAVADVVFGDHEPSGKLPISFPRAVGQIPTYYAHRSTGRPPSDSDPYTSKYIDVAVTPLYPFGHGLSYTRFEY